jgi:hypothetical protein
MAMHTPRTLMPDDLERCRIWEETGTEGGPYEGQLRPRSDLAVAADPESEAGLFVVAADLTFADGSGGNRTDDSALRHREGCLRPPRPAWSTPQPQRSGYSVATTAASRPKRLARSARALRQAS